MKTQELQNATLFFYANWCEACLVMLPFVKEAERLQHTNKRNVLRYVNVDEHPELTNAYHVVILPTIITIQRGRQTRRLTGVLPPPILLRSMFRNRVISSLHLPRQR